jgi:hypothetical protein
MDERKVAGANYIIAFFNEIQLLNHSFSLYVNFIVQLKAKYGEEIDDRAFAEEDKGHLSELSQNVRHHCHKCFIMYKSIYQSIEKLEFNKEVEKEYNDIKDSYVVGSKELEEFVLVMNKAFVEDVIKNLLLTSQDIMKEVFETETTEK